MKLDADEGIDEVRSSSGGDNSMAESLHPNVAAITGTQASVMRRLDGHGICQFMRAGKGFRLVAGIREDSGHPEGGVFELDGSARLESPSHALPDVVDKVRSVLRQLSGNLNQPQELVE